VADSARYLYAICRRPDPAALDGVTGLRGAPLELVDHRGLTAVVSDVPLAEFDEQALKQNLERLDWLEGVARAHDTVVQAATLAGPTAPMRLAVICHDDTGVRERLEEWQDGLVEVLDRIEGRAEWSVKVIVDPPDEQSTPEPPAAGGGADYLRRKKAESDVRRRQRDLASGLADEVHARLSGHVVASRLLQPQDPQLTGHRGDMVLNAAYLVDQEEGERFQALVADVARSHQAVRVELAGPWPPYSFATLDQP
jgi:hypothetical protein